MTLLEFCHLPLRMLDLLGFRFSQAELAGIYALWRYVGHLIGIPAEINPADTEESARLLDLVELTRDAPDEDSRALVAATLGSTHVGAETRGERLTASLLEGAERAMAWHHLPEAHLDSIGSPRSRAKRAMPLLVAAVHTRERMRRRIPNADTRLLRLNSRINDQLLGELKDRAARTRGGTPRASPSAPTQATDLPERAAAPAPQHS